MNSEQVIEIGAEWQFANYYELTQNGPLRNLMVLFYFAYTTLSTIGFGDFAPRSNEERCIGSFLLLLGVAIFSYIIGVFLELIAKFQALMEDNNNDSGLMTFLNVLKKFNKNRNLDNETIKNW